MPPRDIERRASDPPSPSPSVSGSTSSEDDAAPDSPSRRSPRVPKSVDMAQPPRSPPASASASASGGGGGGGTRPALRRGSSRVLLTALSESESSTPAAKCGRRGSSASTGGAAAAEAAAAACDRTTGGAAGSSSGAPSPDADGTTPPAGGAGADADAESDTAPTPGPQGISFTSPAALIPGGGSYNESLDRTDRQFKAAAALGAAAWAFLVHAVYRLAPAESFERLEGVERSAAVMAFSLLLLSNVSRVVPLVLRRRERAFSGVMWGSISVQTVALLTDAFMAFLPVPVLIDPITGGRVHLLRWCEWAPVAGVMTFLTEGVDLPHPKHGRKIGLAHALAQSASTFCGLLFPLCPNGWVWGALMTLSCSLYLTIFVRLRGKWLALRAASPRGHTVDEQEMYDRVKLSFRLLATCSVMWTLLVGLYFAGWLAPLLSSPDSVLHSPAVPMLTETFCEIWSKVLYLLVIVDVHRAVFDEGSRAERRLAELRHMMSAVWESSSDVIAISVRSARDGSVTTMVSPTFHKLEKALAGTSGRKRRTPSKKKKEGGDDHDGRACHDHLAALVFELGSEEMARPVTGGRIRHPVNSKQVHFVPLAGGVMSSAAAGGGGGGGGGGGSRPVQAPASSLPTVAALSELLVLAWRGGDGCKSEEKEALIMHDFDSDVLSGAGDAYGDDDDDGGGGGGGTVRCEAKVTRLEEHALLMVVRDISERFRRFEAEKRVVMEHTAREKDAEANRFTRHEVKNGLLAAIGLCDSLREAFGDDDDDGGGGDGDGGGGGAAGPGGVAAGPPASALALPGDDGAATAAALDRVATAAALLSSASHAWQRKLQDSSGHTVEFDVRRCMTELDATLREVLDTILAQSMARDVVHEVYQPKAERVDIRQVLHGVRGCHSVSKHNDRFPLVTYPSPLPQFMFDPQLLRFVHRNAVSNAVKYGKKGGTVVTEVHFDSKASEIRMDVINLPGERNDHLLRMGAKAESDVFQPGTSLHRGLPGSVDRHQPNRLPFDPEGSTHSSGDGAWIMRKCAEALGGGCSIRFGETRTVFTLRCPARPVTAPGDKNDDPNKFRLPPNTWGIAIDDSKIQRKLLERMFGLLGIDRARVLILGKDAEEIMGFDDTVVDIMRENPAHFIFVIADENLDVVMEETDHATRSGSRCVERIRQRLEPDEERRLLALVRSANDSSDELSLYSSRAHGFLPKAPIKRDKVLETVAPIWAERFRGVSLSPGARRGSSSTPDLRGDDVDLGPGGLAVSTADIMQTVEVIDALCTQGDPSSLPPRWPVIWEKLHVLKGDLKTLKDSVRVTAVQEAIDRLQGTEFPEDFVDRWMLIRSLVVSIM